MNDFVFVPNFNTYGPYLDGRSYQQGHALPYSAFDWKVRAVKEEHGEGPPYTEVVFVGKLNGSFQGQWPRAEKTNGRLRLLD